MKKILENRESFMARLCLKVSPKELDLISQAYHLARECGKERFRDNGGRVFEHYRGVPLILMDEFGVFDHEMIIAGLCHDTAEDENRVNKDLLELIFGKNIAEMIITLTKPNASDKRFRSKEERVNFYHEQIKNASRRVQIIKLADQLHNARELWGCNTRKQRRKIAEMRNCYLPIIENIRLEFPEIAAYLKKELKKALARAERQLTKKTAG